MHKQGIVIKVKLLVDVALSTAIREVGCLSNILLQSLAGMETNASYKNVLYVNEYICKFN